MIIFSVVRPELDEKQIQTRRSIAINKISAAHPEAMIYDAKGLWKNEQEDFICIFGGNKKIYPLIADLCSQNEQEAFVFRNGYYEKSVEGFSYSKPIKVFPGSKQRWDVHIPALDIYVQIADNNSYGAVL